MRKDLFSLILTLSLIVQCISIGKIDSNIKAISQIIQNTKKNLAPLNEKIFLAQEDKAKKAIKEKIKKKEKQVKEHAKEIKKKGKEEKKALERKEKKKEREIESLNTQEHNIEEEIRSAEQPALNDIHQIDRDESDLLALVNHIKMSDKKVASFMDKITEQVNNIIKQANGAHNKYEEWLKVVDKKNHILKRKSDGKGELRFIENQKMQNTKLKAQEKKLKHTIDKVKTVSREQNDKTVTDLYKKGVPEEDSNNANGKVETVTKEKTGKKLTNSGSKGAQKGGNKNNKKKVKKNKKEKNKLSKLGEQGYKNEGKKNDNKNKEKAEYVLVKEKVKENPKNGLSEINQ